MDSGIPDIGERTADASKRALTRIEAATTSPTEGPIY